MRAIDADALLEILKREEQYLRDQDDDAADGILDAIMDVIDATTIESKREMGEWIPYTYVAPDDWYQDKEIRYHCSRCGAWVTNKFNFCPNCGSDMRGNQNG